MNLEPTQAHYLYLAIVLFVIGIWGFVSRRNLIVILISIELMLNSASLAMMTFSRYLLDNSGQIYTLFILVVSACEAAVGLAIILNLVRNEGNLDIDDYSRLKG